MTCSGSHDGGTKHNVLMFHQLSTKRPSENRGIMIGMLDPQICNIGHDANALDRNGSPRDTLVDRFRSLVSAGRLIVIVAGGVSR